MDTTSFMSVEVINTANMNKYATALESLGEKDMMDNCGKIIANGIKPYVPKLSGKLANDYVIYADKDNAEVTWDHPDMLPYSEYQFNGLVKGPNKVLWGNGPSRTGVAAVQAGWYSPVSPKHYTGHKIGDARTITLKDGRVIRINGYTTPGTGAKWTEKATKDISFTIRCGRYLLESYYSKIGKKPIGGYQVLGKYI